MTPPQAAKMGVGVVGDGPDSWEDFVDHLNPRAACELLGLEHFPHWLASAANMLILAEYLGQKYGPEVTVRQALVAELKAGPRPPSGSEETDWWQAIKPHLKELEMEVLAFMKRRGALKEEEVATKGDEAFSLLPDHRRY